MGMIQARLAAQGVEIEFQASNGITVLFGPHGSGKRVVLDSIAGILTPAAGRIILDDEILFDAASRVNLPPRRRHCGYVSARGGLFPHMSLRDNLLFPLAGFARLERRRRAGEMIERYGLAESAGRLPRDCEARDRLRCAVARALIGGPKLLLIDEPAGTLDETLRAEWRKTISQAADTTEAPILLATADLDTGFDLAGRMLLLDRGRILESGAPRKLLDQPSSAAAARLLGIGNVLRAEITALDPGRNTSRLRVEAAGKTFELTGPYFAGRLRGDRVWLCTPAGDLRVTPGGGSAPQANQVAATLARASENARAVSLEFAGGMAAEISYLEFERQKDNKDWLVEFPPQALRVISRDAAEEF
jgi:ABC-type sulfate/molybdate transport systems ATPase subunit